MFEKMVCSRTPIYADVFGPSQPLHPSRWCIHVQTLSHVLCKVSSHLAMSSDSNAEGHNTHDIASLEDGNDDGKHGGRPVYSFGRGDDLFDRVTLSIDCHKYLVCRNPKCKRYARYCSHIRQLHTLLEASHAERDAVRDDARDDGREGGRLWQALGPNVRLVDRMLVFEEENEDAVSIHRDTEQRSTVPELVVSVSTHRISPAVTTCQELKRKNPLRPAPWLPACARCQRTGDPCTHCVPDADGTCDRCGSAWNRDDPVGNGWLRQRRAILLGCYGALEVSTYYRPCQGCDAQKPFDGHDVGIFNLSDSTLFLHELMFQYLDSMTYSKTTFTGFYSMLQDQYARSGCAQLLRSRRIFG